MSPLQKLLPALPAEVNSAEREFYVKYLRENMVVFDVGANIGEFSLLFSRCVGQQGQVHSFEASSRTFAHLRDRCDLDAIGNVILNHVALTDKEGTAKLRVYDGEHAGWNTLADRPLHKYGIDVTPTGIEKVDTTTIDAYCEQNGILEIDLLKIDVEGAEYQVLLGAKRMLREKRIRCCLFEFGQTTFDMGNEPGDIETFLSQLGYHIQNVVQGDPVFPRGSSADTACFSMHIARPKA